MLLQHAAGAFRPRLNLVSALTIAVVMLGGWTVHGIWTSGENSVARIPSLPLPASQLFLPVPVTDIGVGARIGTMRFRMQAQSAGGIAARAIRDIADHHDSVALRRLPAGQPILERDLQRTVTAQNPIVERIPAGMRAMAIKVDATAAVEGWAGSGSTVDVLLVEREHTSVIAERVRILSAERSLAPINSETTPAVPTTVTLLVTQEQCLAIATAAPLGRIAFALRRADDEERWGALRYSSAVLGHGRVSADERQAVVSGAAIVSSRGHTRSYALTDGRWIATEITPQGFFLGQR